MEDGGRIEIISEVVDEENCKITVKDTGKGIKPLVVNSARVKMFVTGVEQTFAISL